MSYVLVLIFCVTAGYLTHLAIQAMNRHSDS